MRNVLTFIICLHLSLIFGQNGNNQLSERKFLNEKNIQHLIPINIIDQRNSEIYQLTMFKEINTVIDSLDFYKSVLEKDAKKIAEIYKMNTAVLPLINNKLKWLDKDRNNDKTISFRIKPNIKELWYLTAFVIYSDIKSYYAEYRETDMNFEEISLNQKTQLLIIGVKDNNYYFKKIELSKITSKVINLDLKQIEFKKLNDLFE